MTPKTESGRARAALLQVVKDWGLDDPRSDPPHGWRCQHPELSDPATCGHVDALVDDLVEAASAAVAEVLDAAEAVIEWLGPCDHFDHHGNCQTHGVEKPCRVETLRALIASERGT